MLRVSLIVTVLIALAASVTACSPLVLVNGITPTDTYIAAANRQYGDDPRQTLDVYQPRSSSRTQATSDGYPVVVFFYGGTWTSGTRGDYKFIGEALASNGILTIVADYRLYPQVRYPDFLTDCARAVAWAQRAARGAWLWWKCQTLVCDGTQLGRVQCRDVGARCALADCGGYCTLGIGRMDRAGRAV